MKVCRRCGEEKELSEFFKRNKSRGDDRYRCMCKKCCKESQRRYYAKNAEKRKAITILWRKNNLEKYRASCRERYKQRIRTPKERLHDSCSTSIRQSLSQCAKNNRSWTTFVGYTVPQLKRHLEKQFTPEMSWDNYGSYWHIDHIVPVSAFNFEKPEDIGFKRCWSLKNLRPLEAIENIRKGNKLAKPLQQSFIFKMKDAA